MASNRSRRILSLINDNAKVKLSRQEEKTPIEIPNSPVNALVFIREYGAESPLPPGAESIDIEMSDVWEDVEDVIANENRNPAVEHQIEKKAQPRAKQQEKLTRNDEDVIGEECRTGSPVSPLPDQETNECNDGVQVFAETAEKTKTGDDNDNPLTPFNLETHTSFECSPAIDIEDLEVSSLNSSAVNSQLSISTPMPSPVNIHRYCEDQFCPSCVNSIVPFSPSTAVSSPSASSTPNSGRKTKKRARHYEDWSEVKRKCLKNLGKKYITKKNKVIDEKVLKCPCQCRDKCYEKISNQERLACFQRYWNTGNKEQQWHFIVKYTDKGKKKKSLNQDKPNKRKFTYKYSLPIISADTNVTQYDTVTVCQVMFINTLSITVRTVKTAWEKYDGSTNILPDMRGRHNNHRVILTEAMIQSVCDHVRSFAPVESHYIRKDSNKLYLDGKLSIAKMHNLYLEWFDAEKYSCKAEKVRQYRDIVDSNFALGFHIPKKDQCDECHIFDQKQNPTEDEKNAYAKHRNNRQVVRDIKSKDKQAAIESDGVILTATFDFEKVLTCPHGNVSIFYYKRKLSCLNFTVFDMGKKQGVCYMWDESVAKRGSNEVSSCLLDFIETNAKDGVKEFRFWSDNCAGQNRNRIVYSLYVYAAIKFEVTITHRFLEKGHTQNEGDSVHAVIERASQSKLIYTPDEWRLLVKWAKVNGNPYIVRNMSQEAFYDFKSQINDKVWLKDTAGSKISWNSIKEVHTDYKDPHKLLFKYDLTQNTSHVLALRSNTRRQQHHVDPKVAYTEPLKIQKDKYKDLVSMCETGIIPTEYHAYFKSLPHQNMQGPEVNDSIDE